MIKLKPYPKYKDSGIQWIGKIPEGWEVNRLKFLLSSLESGSRETGGGSQLDEGVFSLGGEHINWDGTLNLENTKLISEEYYNSMNQGKLKINDILLVKDGATIGKTAIFTKKEFDKMAVNEHVFLMRSNKRINPKLLYYLICSDSGFKQIKLTEVGSAQGGINQDFIAKAYFSIPQDKQDQTTIAAFLDKKNAKFDALIEKDKKLIELLKEKRIALINHAVTKGVSHNVKMKDSGIDCGQIPEKWEVRRIKNLCVVNGRVGWKGLTTNDYVDKGPLLLGAGNIQNNELVLNKYFHIPKDKYDESPEIKIRANDVLLVKVGATIGKSVNVSRVEQDMTVNAALFVLRPRDKIFSRHFNYLLQTRFMQDQININVAENARGNLFERDVKEIRTLKVPYEQQKQIAEYLDKKTSKIDKTINLIQKKIKLLEEFKKSLIHYVVTGKVDVRGVEA